MDLANVNWLYVAIQVPIYIAFFMIGGSSRRRSRKKELGGACALLID